MTEGTHTPAATPGEEYEPTPQVDITEFWRILDRLADASHHDDAERYRATLDIARREGASEWQIKDAWRYGWDGRRKAPSPSFNAWGEPH
ncbi:hypothetical protein [Mobilicoccus caccae]|uniref:DUF4240 domain-containing protein n=1 Tax=Mobilicoccus caccae TaxID=1859295 RepID=A0ABQ6J0B0_9MICO|nr:hypothetical protein [Mobilicoccus caccae]GMA42419.1 hypothetical protein GCM10025883_44640 [Mobilicoccus caccae]